MTFADQILSFYKSLKISARFPKGIEAMNPFQDAAVFGLCEKFYRKFYNDTTSRTLILGINPGRHGGGTTGIPFTDPVKLEKYCGIPNNLPKKPELSADFIYAMIESYGGTQSFYSDFLISAVSPLGYTRDGLNINYYDDKELEKAVRKFIIDSLKMQMKFPINRNACFCLGEGKNYKYLLKLNEEFSFFKEIIPLPHPRFILQYRRKRTGEFVDMYVQKLNSVKG